MPMCAGHPMDENTNSVAFILIPTRASNPLLYLGTHAYAPNAATGATGGQMVTRFEVLL